MIWYLMMKNTMKTNPLKKERNTEDRATATMNASVVIRKKVTVAVRITKRTENRTKERGEEREKQVMTAVMRTKEEREINEKEEQAATMRREGKREKEKSGNEDEVQAAMMVTRE